MQQDENFAKQAEAEAEAERPEAVAFVKLRDGKRWRLYWEDEFLSGDEIEALMTVAQHERIVKAWIERWKAYIELSAKIAAQRDAALARVAELEMILRELNTSGLMQFSTADEEKAVRAALSGAQAQQLHDLDKQCRDDVARALGLRPSQERGFAWSYLLASIKSCVKASEDAAQAQHSVPDGWVQSLTLKDHQPCKANEDRANGYTIPVYSSPVSQAPHSVPDVCDGKEQDAFEEWATKQGMNMQCHPMHWLFLDAKTNSARQGWKAALKYARNMIAAPGNSAQNSVPAAWYYDAPSQAEAAIIDIRGMWGEDDCPTYEDVASALRRLLAAAPGKEDV